MTLILVGRRRGGAAAGGGGGGGGGGSYSRLAPVYATLPTGITFNSTTGLYDGTVYDTTEPTWGSTVALTDTVNAATNRTNLQNAINSAASGQTSNTRITIPAGMLVAGTITLPANSTGFWVGIMTASWASLPALSAGNAVGTTTNRVTASHTSLMPELYATATNDAIFTSSASGVQKYFLRGLYFSNRSVVSNDGGMVQLVTNYPSDIVVAQNVAIGSDWNTVRRVCYFGGQRMALIDSYATNIGQLGFDSQHLLVGPGAGPHKYTNNYSNISGPSENFMSGGMGLPGTDATYLPRHLEIRGNQCNKPAGQGSHKPHIEIKFGTNILIEGNVLHEKNAGGIPQSIVLKLTNQGGTNTATDTADVVIANNRIYNAPTGFSITGSEFYSGTNRLRRVDVINNEFTRASESPARGLQLGPGGSGPVESVNIQWNTIVGGPGSLNAFATGLSVNDNGSVSGAIIKNNIFVGSDTNPTFVFNHFGGGGTGEAGIAAGISGGTVTGNLVTSTNATQYANQVRTTDVTTVGFTNTSTADYSLSGSSPGFGTAEGGNNIGTATTLLNTRLSGVV